MRKRGRVDDNHSSIVKRLRVHGASVVSLANLGKGVPDLLIGFKGLNLLAEVKDGNKPPSGRKLTPDEQEFATAWRGDAPRLLEREEDCDDLIDRIRSAGW